MNRSLRWLAGVLAWWKRERAARIERHAADSRALEDAGDLYGAEREARRAGDEERARAVAARAELGAALPGHMVDAGAHHAR